MKFVLIPQYTKTLQKIRLRTKYANKANQTQKGKQRGQYLRDLSKNGVGVGVVDALEEKANLAGGGQRKLQHRDDGSWGLFRERDECEEG